MNIWSQPIDWSYPVRPENMTDNYISLIVTLSVIFIVYMVAVIICNSYLRRRKKGIKRFYECAVTYKEPGEDDEPTETLYITTYGWLDIKMFFMRFASVKVKRIKNPEDYDFIDLDRVIKMEKDEENETTDDDCKKTKYETNKTKHKAKRKKK